MRPTSISLSQALPKPKDADPKPQVQRVENVAEKPFEKQACALLLEINQKYQESVASSKNRVDIVKGLLPKEFLGKEDPKYTEHQSCLKKISQDYTSKIKAVLDLKLKSDNFLDTLEHWESMIQKHASLELRPYVIEITKSLLDFEITKRLQDNPDSLKSLLIPTDNHGILTHDSLGYYAAARYVSERGVRDFVKYLPLSKKQDEPASV
jgi:uncharacterized membrane protein YheB (UPF0754 family)